MSLPTEDDRPSDAGEAETEEGSLVGDLEEVERASPERAFNVGVGLGALVTVAAAIFVLQNSQSTSFDWLWFDFSMPLWAALMGAVAVGVVLTATALAVHHRRRARIGRRHEATARLRRFLSRGDPDAAGTRRHHQPMEPGKPA